MRKLRLIHLWVGVIASFFVITLGATGVVLDHRDSLKVGHEFKTDNGLFISKGVRPEDLPVSFSKAMDIARTNFGKGVLLDKIELKETGNGLVFRVEAKSKDEIFIDPVTGDSQMANTGSSQLVKISKMLHTGDGLVNFPWIYDAVAFSMIFLAVSGTIIYARRFFR